MEHAHYLTLALDNGVKPCELSEIITHLAFYSGWANARGRGGHQRTFSNAAESASRAAARVRQPCYRSIEAETQRAPRSRSCRRPVSPGLVHYTTEVLFRDLWLRPGLSPRDRSLVTVSALVAGGQVAQMTFHLNRAMDNGLTKAQASEVLCAPRVLRRVAERVLGRSRREGSLREAAAVILQRDRP